jgi:hypothetical protein
MGKNTAAETSSPQLDAEDSRQDALREAFVAMLFALAVGQVAIHAADVWKLSDSLSAKSPAFAHLFLALTLIAASWVGWKRSRSPGMRRSVESVFSRSFVGLLVDVILVVIYFIIVRQVEIEQKGDVIVLLPASAKPEAGGLAAVFVVYGVWDLLTDVFPQGCIPKSLGVLAWTSKASRLAAVSTFASALCMGLSWLAYWRATLVDPKHDGLQVFLIDVALLSVVLVFRAAKAAENPLSRWLKVTDCEAFKRTRAVQGNELRWCIALLLVYAVALVLATRGT